MPRLPPEHVRQHGPPLADDVPPSQRRGQVRQTDRRPLRDRSGCLLPRSELVPEGRMRGIRVTVTTELPILRTPVPGRSFGHHGRLGDRQDQPVQRLPGMDDRRGVERLGPADLGGEQVRNQRRRLSVGRIPRLGQPRPEPRTLQRADRHVEHPSDRPPHRRRDETGIGRRRSVGGRPSDVLRRRRPGRRRLRRGEEVVARQGTLTNEEPERRRTAPFPPTKGRPQRGHGCRIGPLQEQPPGRLPVPGVCRDRASRLTRRSSLRPAWAAMFRSGLMTTERRVRR